MRRAGQILGVLVAAFVPVWAPIIAGLPWALLLGFVAVIALAGVAYEAASAVDDEPTALTRLDELDGLGSRR